ncbi:cytochrome P450, partial [Aureobasidium melanogenum]
MPCPMRTPASDVDQSNTASPEYLPIPQPPEHLFGLLGNLPDLDPSFPSKNIWSMQQLYGPIMKLKLGSEQVILGDQQHINEICDEKRFHKKPSGALVAIRALTGDGLFTAYDSEVNWWKAHRMLVPAFGPIALRSMFDDMLDVSSQMVLKWDRLGPENEIECSDDLTRLAFDTIGLCAFSYRFNEFYTDHAHPFAQQMADVLTESGRRVSRPGFINDYVYRSDEQKRQENVKKMHDLCDQIVADRKKNPQPENKDLLNTMLNTIDKETGEGLSDENIRYQMATFLVAGHETTSSTLSFTYYNLLKNPDKLLKVQREVDDVVGDNVLELQHLPKLKYLDACIKETLRLSSPISRWGVCPREDTTLQGKYEVKKDVQLSANLRSLHHDPAVWGDDHEDFKPERMLQSNFEKLPPNSWKPFGNGMRSCIGRGFAEQEMLINIALVLQRFQLELADPAYELELKSTLTIKPWNFRMKARRRPGKALTVGIPGGVSANAAKKHEEQHGHAEAAQAQDRSSDAPLSIFFGGNTGTCEALAEDLKTKLADHDLSASIESLDTMTEHTPDQPVVIITSSYEGLPPDNAKEFVAWLEDISNKNTSALNGVKYAVYGVGNSDWASTFHRIPKLVHELMKKAGAADVVDIGLSDVKADLFGPWEDWVDQLIDALVDSRGARPVAKAVTEVIIRESKLTSLLGGKDMNIGTVIANEELAGTEVGPAKRHMDIRLPDGMSYTAGDYLVVQPRNPDETVHRILSYFGLRENDMLEVKGSSKVFLPTEPTPVSEFLSGAVELSQPITKRQLEAILSHATPEQQEEYKGFLQDAFYQHLLETRYSILDILEETAIALPFSAYIDMLPALTPRQYSIASSYLEPANNPQAKQHADVVSLCFDVHTSPALSGHGSFFGVTSTYLASRRIGDRISCFVRPTNVGFRLPGNVETPIIMFAAGTGIALMRAFLQERAAIAAAGARRLGPAILFFGCRHSEKDFIYRDELAVWEKQGVVKVVPSFSKGDSGPHYVQDAVWEHREEVAKMFANGGKIYLCGSAARLGKSAAEVCKKIWCERNGKSMEDAEKWLQSVKTDRYISDVY